MANKLLISESKLKNFTNINQNVDINAIRAEIGVSQDLYLQPVLGTKFYNELLDKISSTGNTFTSIEKTLVNDYIAPYLIQKSYAEIIPHLWVRTMNRGLGKGESESNSSVDKNTMAYLKNLQDDRADFYKQRLLDWLCNGGGQNQFPSYNSYSSSDGMQPNKDSHYNSPIVLNHTNRKGYPRIPKGIEVYSEEYYTDRKKRY